MSERSPVSNESVLKKWMRLEIRKINEGVVSERKTLSQLLLEDTPSAGTKGGELHVFDREVLTRLKTALPGTVCDRLRLPILFYFDMTIRDSCFLADEYAVIALQKLGEISHLHRLHEGRLWISKPIAYAIIKKYPTACQIVMR